MSAITTHVLDTSRGSPAEGVSVVLERLSDSHTPQVVAVGATDADGRIPDLLPAGELVASGRYHLTFDTGAYFRARGVETFYPEVSVAFVIRDVGQHYHVPLLLSPFAYSTYRGS